MQRVAIGRALVRRPRDLPDGRAAVLARRQAARGTAARAQAHPGRARRDDPLRHARPDRGHDHGRPHRRASRRAGSCSSARRARSTRARPASTSPRGSARRRSTCCPSALLPDGGAGAAPRRSACGTEHIAIARRERPTSTGRGRAGSSISATRDHRSLSRSAGTSCIVTLADPASRSRGRATTVAASRSAAPLFFDRRRPAACGVRHRRRIEARSRRSAGPDRCRGRGDHRHADELTALDQAIGDGDHGINMKRGFEAMLAERDALAAKPLRRRVARRRHDLVTKVGGASGPLYGTLLMAHRQGAADEPDAAPMPRRLRRGRGEREDARQVGRRRRRPCSTCWCRCCEALAAAAPTAARCAASRSARPRGDQAACWRPAGRASFLGERSIGHIDPGAAPACS